MSFTKGTLYYILVLFLLLSGCNSTSDTVNIITHETGYKFTDEEIAIGLESEEIHLKPQGEFIVPDLNEITSSKYELLDSVLYIYIFEDNEHLKKGLTEVKEVFESRANLYFYELNNALVIYHVHPSTPLELEKETNKELQNRIKELIESISS